MRTSRIVTGGGALALVLAGTLTVASRRAGTTGGRAADADARRWGQLTPTGAALRDVFVAEAPDAAWTKTARDRVAPLLFAAGFELECRQTVCVLETTFGSNDAFRDFIEAAFEGRNPIWRGTFLLASVAPSGAAGAGYPWRAVFFLGDRRRAAARLPGAEAHPVIHVTPATTGFAWRASDARSWSVRRAEGEVEGTMQNVSHSRYGELVVPLRPITDEGARRGRWRAFVAVGGVDLASRPVQCVLEQKSDAGGGAPVVTGSSGPETYDASYDVHSGTIELTLPDGAPSAEAVVRCFVPPQGWIGDVTWHLATDAGAHPISARGPYASNL